MKCVSLFAGIGGFDLALTRIGHEIVYANEWDKYAAQTYEKNFGHNPDTRDIKTVPGSDIPEHDILVGGFPCQAFSVAGKRQGFNETRGTLFFDIARILTDKRPRYLLLENVKGLLSHDFGKTFQTILRVLSGLGYELQWQVLNSKDFGVPQNRERVFIIGHLRGEPRPKVFPIGEGDGLPQESKGERALENKSTAITTNYRKGVHSGGETYISHTVRSGGAKSPFGSKQNWDTYMLNGIIRRLTPIECERLQGFPDGWTEGVSDTQRYKQLGNAVTVNVVEAILKRFL